MEANLKIIEQMCEEQGISASPEAKEALVNFAVLFGEKLVRNCMIAKPIGQKVSVAEIRKSYELMKNIYSPEHEIELEARTKQRITSVNRVAMINDQAGKEKKQRQDKSESEPRTAVTIKLHNSEIYHMCLGKEHQIIFE